MIFLKRTGGKLLFLMLCLILLFVFSQRHSQEIWADTQSSPPTEQLTKMETSLKKSQFPQAKEEFQTVKQWWYQAKQKVKHENLTLAQQIDLGIGQLSVSLLNEDIAQARLQQAKLALAFKQLTLSKQDQTGLAGYVLSLEQLASYIQQSDWVSAQALIEQLTTQWLSVEGDVVAQSQTIYDNSEKNLLLIKNSIQAHQNKRATTLVKQLKTDLSSITNHTYTVFDVAMIPFREGLEALLVIALLISVLRRQTKAEQTKRGVRMILYGSGAGILVSLAAGLSVILFLSVIRFGNNQNVINGFAGVISSLMLLYVGIWMHRAADVKKTTAYYAEKSQSALSNGNYFGLFFLAFLAVVREGLEIVLFLIGMFGKVQASTVLMGFGVGIFFLAVIALLFFKFQKSVPLSLFFTLSSLIIFYLAVKFMGSGIHSLQLANILPNTIHEYLPSNNTLSIYPSWLSFAPQLLLSVAFVISLWVNRKKKEKLSK